MIVGRVDALNRRVLIRLDEYTLIVTQVSKLTQNISELPTTWLYEKWVGRGDEFALQVKLEDGSCEVIGRDLRLIRNNDLAILIPAIDT